MERNGDRMGTSQPDCVSVVGFGWREMSPGRKRYEKGARQIEENRDKSERGEGGG